MRVDVLLQLRLKFGLQDQSEFLVLLLPCLWSKEGAFDVFGGVYDGNIVRCGIIRLILFLLTNISHYTLENLQDVY